MIHDTIPVCPEYTPEAVSVFGPESVSYERSRRENRTKFHDFSARVFFVQIPKCQDSMIYAIYKFFRIQFLKNVLVQKCPGRARARPHGPGPWARPIHGPGQAHMPGPNMGPGLGPWDWAWARAGHIWTRTFFRNCILKKNPNVAYIIESWHFGILTKKARAEKCCILACFGRRDLSYETDSGPKTKTD